MTGCAPSTLSDPVRAHFTRLHAEPDYDQHYARERVLTALQGHINLIALLGPGGSGKTWTLAYQILPAIRTALTGCEAGTNIQVTSPTNLGVNVLRRRGVNAMTNHSALYQLSFGPSVEAIQQWLINGAAGQLPDDVSPRLAAAWRNASSGPRERAQHKAKVDMIEAALRDLGLAGGFMDVLPPRWGVREDLDTTVSVWIVDEASMMTSKTLEDIQKLARFVLVVGDPFQLPAILEHDEILRGITGALAQVPLAQQVHLHRDRRTRGATQHLRAAQAILCDTTTLRDIDHWAGNGEIPGLRAARRFDLSMMAHAPALSFYRTTVVRLCVEHRRAAGLPDEQLVPGERLLIESIARDRRDQLAELGIFKNARVVVLQQTSPYQALVIAEHILDQLIRGAQEQGREPTRQEVLGLAASIPIGVTYARDELENAGVTPGDISLLAPVRGQGVNARFGAASTTHKSQGSSYPTVQISADDMFGYSRSQYGNEVADDVPVPVWRRLVYTALTRAEESVIWVNERRGYRAVGTSFDGELDAVALEATLPTALHGLSLDDARDDLDAALSGGTTANQNWPGFSASSPGTAQIIELNRPATKPATEIAEPPPQLPTDLANWLIDRPDLVPQRLPTSHGETFRFEVRRKHNLTTAEITVERRDQQDQVTRRSILRPGQAGLTAALRVSGMAGRYAPLVAGLDHDDAKELTALVQRLRRGDRDVFTGLVTCASCGRRLTDPVSRRFGIGPVCAQRYGITLPTAAGECGA